MTVRVPIKIHIGIIDPIFLKIRERVPEGLHTEDAINLWLSENYGFTLNLEDSPDVELHAIFPSEQDYLYFLLKHG